MKVIKVRKLLDLKKIEKNFMYINLLIKIFNLAKKNMQNYYTRVPVYGGVPIHGIPVHGIPGNVRIVHKKRAVPTGKPPTVTVRHVWG